MNTTINETLKSATRRLADGGIDSPRLDAEVLLAHVLNCRRLDLYVDAEKILSLEKILRFNELISRRLEGIPVAYLTGTREFMGLKFSVTPDVLIPRPDTEIVTEFVGEFLRALNREVSFADIGTGSGAICVSILKFIKTARSCAVDVSSKALEVAELNARKFHVDDRIKFFCGDMFAPLSGKIFDAIVSNPPYIPTGDLPTLQAEVQSEPTLALDGGTDGLTFYRRLADASPKFLSSGGLLAVEVGINQASTVKEIFTRAGFVDVEILRDLSGIERVVCGRKNFPAHV